VHEQDQAQDRQTGPERDIDRPPTEPQEPDDRDESSTDEPDYRFPGNEPGAQGAPMTSDAPQDGGAATGATTSEEVDPS
jgi:hypothetical protein